MSPIYSISKRTRIISLMLLLVGLLIVLAQPIIASELPDEPNIEKTYPLSGLVLPDGTVTADAIGWCPSNANICRVNRQWTIDEVKAKLGYDNWTVWQEDKQLIFAFHGDVPEVFIAGGISTDLAPINNSHYWVATVHIAELDQAVIGYLFIVRQNDKIGIIEESYDVWRGKRAPQAPELAVPLKGQHATELFYSAELDEIRLVSYYLPPNYSYRETYPVIYIADGQSLASFARTIEPLIEKQVIPPTILVGVHTPEREYARNRRAEEYILGVNDEAYQAHEHFFTETVRRWAELRLHASEDPSERAIMGYSNGAAFAGNTGVRKPDIYGHVMALSITHHPLINLRSRIDARYYVSAGTLDPPVHSVAKRVHFNLLLLGVEAQLSQRVSGHDWILWREEFPQAVQWMFAEDS